MLWKSKKFVDIQESEIQKFKFTIPSLILTIIIYRTTFLKVVQNQMSKPNI